MRESIPWKDQYKHPLWQKKRLEAFEAHGYACQRCGDGENQLHVHHKRYVKGRMIWEYSPTELAVLCDGCHEQDHAENNLLKDLLARLRPGQAVEILALIVGYLGRIAWSHKPDVDDIYCNEIVPQDVVSAGDLAALAANRLDIYQLFSLTHFLSSAKEGDSTTIKIKAKTGFGG